MSKRKVCTHFDDFVEKTMANTVKIEDTTMIHNDSKFLNKTIWFFTRLVSWSFNLYSNDKEYINLLKSEFDAKLSPLKLITCFSDAIKVREAFNMVPFRTKARYFDLNGTDYTAPDSMYVSYGVQVDDKYTLCMDMEYANRETVKEFVGGDKKKLGMFLACNHALDANRVGFMIAKFSMVETETIRDMFDEDESDGSEDEDKSGDSD